MSKEIFINIGLKEKRVAILEEGNLEEFYIERSGEKSLVGNIYKAKVLELRPHLEAAFVELGLNKRGFLYLEEELQTTGMSEPIEYIERFLPTSVKVGEDILVQVVKDPFSKKGPRVSSHIALAARFLVLLPQDRHIGISRRIEDAERRRLRQLLQHLRLPKNVGFIVRTVGAHQDRRQFVRDAKFLWKLWRRIRSLSYRKSAPALVYEEYDLVLKTIRDCFSEIVSRIVVDNREEYRRIFSFIRHFLGTSFTKRLELYKEKRPLFESEGVEKQIEAVYQRKINLRGGGWITIEPTEAMTVIDINSGRFSSGADQEKTAYLVNLRSAREIARQLRLRDLGGIIVIDFIDMDKEGYRKAVLNTLKEALKPDRAKTEVMGISKLGLVEMTRERKARSVESIVYQSCPYCQGRGMVRKA